MSIDLICRFIVVLLVTPTAVELSVWIGDFGCGQPILVRVLRRGTMLFAHMKRPARSASAAEDMTNLIICAMARTGPLSDGTGTSSESMMCAPARLRDLMTLRYAALECAASIIPLAW